MKGAVPSVCWHSYCGYYNHAFCRHPHAQTIFCCRPRAQFQYCRSRSNSHAVTRARFCYCQSYSDFHVVTREPIPMLPLTHQFHCCRCCSCSHPAVVFTQYSSPLLPLTTTCRHSFRLVMRQSPVQQSVLDHHPCGYKPAHTFRFHIPFKTISSACVLCVH